jgi:hypothetical protein
VSLRGDISKLRALEKSLRELPTTVAFRVAEASAATITRLARGTFDAGQNPYGDDWDLGKEGEQVRLRRTGRLAGDVEYVATGTKLRARLGPKYAIYQVGRRPVFPRNGSRLPVAYVNALKAKAAEIIESELKGATR